MKVKLIIDKESHEYACQPYLSWETLPENISFKFIVYFLPKTLEYPVVKMKNSLQGYILCILLIKARPPTTHLWDSFYFHSTKHRGRFFKSFHNLKKRRFPFLMPFSPIFPPFSIFSSSFLPAAITPTPKNRETTLFLQPK